MPVVLTLTLFSSRIFHRACGICKKQTDIYQYIRIHYKNTLDMFKCNHDRSLTFRPVTTSSKKERWDSGNPSCPEIPVCNIQITILPTMFRSLKSEWSYLKPFKLHSVIYNCGLCHWTHIGVRIIVNNNIVVQHGSFSRYKPSKSWLKTLRSINVKWDCVIWLPNGL